MKDRAMQALYLLALDPILEVHQTMQQAADHIVAGLLAQVGQQPSLEGASKKSC